VTLLVERPEADRLAREVASLAGETVEEAVIRALGERLERLRVRPPVDAGEEERRRRLTDLFARARAAAKAEGLRPPTTADLDGIVGYNERGCFD
jgi:antitoxin VapB